MALSKADAETIKEKLSHIFGEVLLNCDGYAVYARLEKSKMKLVIAVYVNGGYRGIDFFHDKESLLDTMTDISRRFYNIKSVGHSAKETKLIIRIYGKIQAKKEGRLERRCWTIPYFATANSFIAHIKKHNQSIEIITREVYQAMIEALPKEVANG